mmetsp:Transcript_5757/g.9596  ORF Transcript_5757/g.9596 Transcript_5757/m.9596 type:complete len:235 (+) Transcript_5757:897-1601(+)
MSCLTLCICLNSFLLRCSGLCHCLLLFGLCCLCSHFLLITLLLCSKSPLVICVAFLLCLNHLILSFTDLCQCFYNFTFCCLHVCLFCITLLLSSSGLLAGSVALCLSHESLLLRRRSLLHCLVLFRLCYHDFRRFLIVLISRGCIFETGMAQEHWKAKVLARHRVVQTCRSMALADVEKFRSRDHDCSTQTCAGLIANAHCEIVCKQISQGCQIRAAYFNRSIKVTHTEFRRCL